MNVFDLLATISLDNSEFNSGLTDSEGKADSFASSIASKFTSAGKVAMAGIGAIAGAVTGATVALTAGVGAVAEYGDNIDKTSQKLGVSSQFYQEWEAVLQHSGTSMDNMGATFKTLSKAVQNGSAGQQEAFAKLGLSMDELSGMSTEEVFSTTISKLQEMEEGTERTALATQLLGRGAMELGPLLNTSAEDTQAMIDQVNALNGVMGEDAVKASAEYQDKLQDLQTSIGGLKNKVMSEFLPGMSTVMEGLTMIFSGQDGGVEKVSEGIDNIIQTITEGLPKFMEIGGQIVGTLFDALIQNLPQIFQGGTQLIIELISGLIDSLPSIIEAMITVITTVAEQITENLPVIIPKVIDAVIAVAEALINNVDKIIVALVKVMVVLAVEIVKNIPKIIASVIKLIGKIISTIGEKTGDLVKKGLDMGKQFLLGIWNGIKEKIQWLKDKVNGFVDDIKDTVKSALGINSPSRWGAEMGDFLMQGFGNGIAEGTKGALKTMEDAMDDIKNIGETDMTASMRVVPTVDKPISNESQILGAMFNQMAMPDEKEHITIVTLDGKEIARAVDKPLQAINKQRGLTFTGGTEAWT